MNVIVCVTESEESMRALNKGVEYAKQNDLSLQILHGLEKNINELNGSVVHEDRDTAYKRSQKLIRKMKNEVEDSHSELDIETHVLDSEHKHNPVEKILQHIEDSSVDRIFLGNRGLGTKHRSVGSFSEKIVNKSDVPTTVIEKTGDGFEIIRYSKTQKRSV